MDLTGAMDLSGVPVVRWCGVCNAEPAIGEINVEHEPHELPTIAIGYDCIRKISAEQGGVAGWTDEYDGLDKEELVW